jgi:hypothetical protein
MPGHSIFRQPGRRIGRGYVRIFSLRWYSCRLSFFNRPCENLIALHQQSLMRWLR